MINKELYNKIESTVPGSAWRKGVKAQALEMVEMAEVELTRDNALQELLNGAEDWYEYSSGGCALSYDEAIAERYCTPSELKATRNGQRDPNSMETWLDLQARALNQAYRLILRNL